MKFSALTLAALLTVAAAQFAQANDHGNHAASETDQQVEELRALDTNNDGIISDEERAAAGQHGTAEDAGE